MSPSHHAVLVHSPFTTAAAWGEVPARLRGRGWMVTVTEVLDDNPPYAAGFVAHVAQQLQLAAPGESLLLVGHGAAGPLLPQIGFARQSAGHPVRGYVFVDALLPRPLHSANLIDLIAASDARRAEGAADRLGDSGVFPQVSDSELVDALADPDVRVATRAVLRPRALDWFTQTLPLPSDWPDAPCGFVQLSDTFAAEARTAHQRGWAVRSVKAHHFWAVSDPDGLAEVLCDVVQSGLEGP